MLYVPSLLSNICTAVTIVSCSSPSLNLPLRLLFNCNSTEITSPPMGCCIPWLQNVVSLNPDGTALFPSLSPVPTDMTLAGSEGISVSRSSTLPPCPSTVSTHITSSTACIPSFSAFAWLAAIAFADFAKAALDTLLRVKLRIGMRVDFIVMICNVGSCLKTSSSSSPNPDQIAASICSRPPSTTMPPF